MLSHQQKTRFINLFASPFVLALPVAVIIILFVPAPAYKYKVQLISQEYIAKPGIQAFYYDLNGDEVDEELEFYSNTKGGVAFKVVKPDGCNYEQWNFPGYYEPYSGRHFCADLNKDGFPEVYVFYYNDDSVFMGAVQPYPEKKVLFLKKFITCINKRNGKIDFIIDNFQTADMNGDGNEDLIFDVVAGFSKQPRKIFIYNPVSGKFRSSKSLGAKFEHLIIADLNHDSIPEIYCATSASGNIHDSIRFPYNDYSSWFMGFDNKLQFLFKPIRLNRYPQSSDIQLFKNRKCRKFIATSAYDYNKKKYRLAFYTAGGKEYSRFSFPLYYSFVRNGQTFFKPVQYQGKPYIFFCNKNGTFYLYDENFHFKKVKTNLQHQCLVFAADLNHDGKKEYLFKNGFHPEFTITNHNFKITTRFTSHFKQTGLQYHWGIIRLPHKKYGFYVQNDNILHIFTYTPDPFYYVKYPLWILLYAIIVGILWFSQRMYKIQIQRKQQIEETINTLQMKTIRSQMDPHFMFNILNGLASNIVGGKRDKAYNYTLRFSKLLRAMMNKTERIDITLENEIDFVRNYLELEKYRFKEDFDFTIEIEKGVDLNLKIPRMLVQLLVENAIKHGLRTRTGQKKLGVQIKRHAGKTVITVEDNGIGRKAAAKIPSGTGKGLKLIHDMIRLNQKLGGRPITLSYIDLYNESGQPVGTRAQVIIEEKPEG